MPHHRHTRREGRPVGAPRQGIASLQIAFLRPSQTLDVKFAKAMVATRRSKRVPSAAPAATESDDDMPEEVSHKAGRRLVEQQEEHEQKARAAVVEAARIKKRQRKERLKKRRDERRALEHKDEDVLSTDVLAAAAAARSGGDDEERARPRKKVKRRQRVRGADAAGNVSDAGLLAAPRHVEGNVHVVHLPRADSATAALAAADRAMIALSGAGRLGDTRNMSSASATSSASQFLAEQEALVGGRRVNAASFLSCRRRGAPMRFGSRAGWS